MKKIRGAEKPYEGDNPFIFISYSHKDIPYVYPIIEYLARDGYRVWYDEGITPGSEWNEVIADHMTRANMCIAFISENAAASHHCRREISFALSKNKPLLSVFLEDTILTPGMEMQLSANQSVFAHTYTDIEKFTDVLKASSLLTPCLGEPSHKIEIRSPSYYKGAYANPAENVIDISDEWFCVGGGQKIDKKNVEPTNQEAEEKLEHVLFRKLTGEIIALDSSGLQVGRIADSTQTSYVISNNNEVSRKHFVITEENGTYFITDCKSKNGTFLNGSTLPPDVQTPINIGDEIRISTEYFIFQTKPTGGNRLP